MEEWRPVVGAPGYEVSDLGRVRSPRCVLRGSLHKKGYRLVGVGKTRLVHALVAEAFIGPRPPGKQIRHLDGMHANNVPSNLAYGTRAENAQDILRHGRNHERNKTHCTKGHPYSGANLQITPEGWRRCAECNRVNARKHR